MSSGCSPSSVRLNLATTHAAASDKRDNERRRQCTGHGEILWMMEGGGEEETRDVEEVRLKRTIGGSENYYLSKMVGRWINTCFSLINSTRKFYYIKLREI